MEFEHLVRRVQDITGLNLIQAARLSAGNVFILSGGDMIMASADPYIPAKIANMVIDIATDSVINLPIG